MHPTSYIAIITTQVVSASGYANLFVDGYSAPSTLNTAVDVGARTVSGLIEGGSVGSSQTLSNPYFVVATGTGATWTVTNNIYLNGDFSGRFSKNWTANSFSGKGSVTVSKVDIAGFMAAASSSAAASNPAAAAIAAPQMLTVARSIKVEGVKTTDVATPFTPTAAFSMPTITQN